MPCSNAAKTRNQLKFAGVPQTPEPISAVSGPKFTLLSRHVEEVLLLNMFFPIVDTCLNCEDMARQSCAMVPRWRFLHPVFAASRVQRISDLHSKFALRPHHSYEAVKLRNVVTNWNRIYMRFATFFSKYVTWPFHDRAESLNTSSSFKCGERQYYLHFCSTEELVLIFFLKQTRRVAVCLWTHCNIGLKTACWPLVSDVEPSYLIWSLYLWRCAVRLETLVDWHSTPCLKKRHTFTTCSNFYIHSSIATIFGINVAEKVGN